MLDSLLLACTLAQHSPQGTQAESVLLPGPVTYPIYDARVTVEAGNVLVHSAAALSAAEASVRRAGLLVLGPGGVEEEDDEWFYAGSVAEDLVVPPAQDGVGALRFGLVNSWPNGNFLQGSITAFATDTNTGDLVWERVLTPPTAGIAASVLRYHAASDRLVCIGNTSSSATIWGLDASTGNLQWSLPLGRPANDSLFEGDTLIVGSSEGGGTFNPPTIELRKIRMADGGSDWFVNRNGLLGELVAVPDSSRFGAAIHGNGGAQVAVFESADGSEVWATPTGFASHQQASALEISGTPSRLIASFLRTTPGIPYNAGASLHAFEPNTGALLWSRVHSGGSGNLSLVAPPPRLLEAGPNSVAWQLPTFDANGHRVTRLEMVDPQTGQEIVSAEDLGGPGGASPTGLDLRASEGELLSMVKQLEVGQGAAVKPAKFTLRAYDQVDLSLRWEHTVTASGPQQESILVASLDTPESSWLGLRGTESSPEALELVCVSTEGLDEQWTSPTGDGDSEWDPSAQVAADHGVATVWLASGPVGFNSSVFVHDLKTGALRWSKALGPSVFPFANDPSDPANESGRRSVLILEGQVVVLESYKQPGVFAERFDLVALDSADGAELWRTSLMADGFELFRLPWTIDFDGTSIYAARVAQDDVDWFTEIVRVDPQDGAVLNATPLPYRYEVRSILAKPEGVLSLVHPFSSSLPPLFRAWLFGPGASGVTFMGEPNATQAKSLGDADGFLIVTDTGLAQMGDTQESIEDATVEDWSLSASLDPGLTWTVADSGDVILGTRIGGLTLLASAWDASDGAPLWDATPLAEEADFVQTFALAEGTSNRWWAGVAPAVSPGFLDDPTSVYPSLLRVDLPRLFVNPEQVVASVGAALDVRLNGQELANSTDQGIYLALAARELTLPGINLGNASLPFDPLDPLLISSIVQANQGPFGDTLGALDHAANGRAAIAIPPGVINPIDVNGRLYLAWIRLDPQDGLAVSFASQPVELGLE
jgi:outer membrane protein assembly factor BamB